MVQDEKCNQSALYIIRVRGSLDPAWSDWFDGLLILQCDRETIIAGPVVDQAALFGILAKINDLGLVLISVNELTGIEQLGVGFDPDAFSHGWLKPLMNRQKPGE